MSGTGGSEEEASPLNESGTDSSPRQMHPRHPACANCKRLKVRCVRSDPENPVSPCLRCIKKHIECVMYSGIKRHNDDLDPRSKRSALDLLERRRPHLTSQSFQKSVKETPVNYASMRDQLLTSWRVLADQDDMRLRLLEEVQFESVAKPSNNVVQRGLITQKDAMTRLDLYRRDIYPLFPAVPCPEGNDIGAMFNEAPLLTHTILDIASLLLREPKQVESSIILHNIVLRNVVDEIMIVSVKNMELLQCLILLTHWYNESEPFHQQRHRALTSVAVSVAHDLGLGGSVPLTAGDGRAPAFEQMVTPFGSSHPESKESLRAWLAVYGAVFQSLLANRRPIICLFNSYTKHALQELEKNPDTLTHPERAIPVQHLARIRHIQEEITLSLYKRENDPVAPDYTHPATHYLLDHFDRQIDMLQSEVPAGYMRLSAAVTMCRVTLHQGVLYKAFDEAAGRAPFTNLSLYLDNPKLGVIGARSFTVCVRSAVDVLRGAVSQPLSMIATENISFWTSVAQCCDVLLKCRMCSMFNREYATALLVNESDLRHVVSVVNMCDELTRQFPNCNNAVSFGFFVKLLLCHHDARVHYFAARAPATAEILDPAVQAVQVNMQQQQIQHFHRMHQHQRAPRPKIAAPHLQQYNQSLSPSLGNGQPLQQQQSQQSQVSQARQAQSVLQGEPGAPQNGTGVEVNATAPAYDSSFSIPAGELQDGLSPPVAYVGAVPYGSESAAEFGTVQQDPILAQGIPDPATNQSALKDIDEFWKDFLSLSNGASYDFQF